MALEAWLDRFGDQLDGLSDAQLRSASVEPSLTLPGLVQHVSAGV